jgi:hypothetical protein
MRSKDSASVTRASVTLNQDCVPNSANPHTHLMLVGDAADAPYPRVMFGCLRPEFRGHINSATAFAQAKVMVAASVGTPPWVPTAAWTEVLLPAPACDRFSDPETLMRAVDLERPAKVNALLSYFTVTYPVARLHVMLDEVRGFVREHIVEAFDVAALIVLHDPGRAASANLPHVHVLVVPRRLTSIGLAEQVGALTTDKAHPLIRDLFLTHWSARR